MDRAYSSNALSILTRSVLHRDTSGRTVIWTLVLLSVRFQVSMT